MKPIDNAPAGTPPALPLALPEPRQVYQLFSTLHSTAAAHFHATLGGTLLLLPALDSEGSALALAASIAGAASLSIDPDSARLKQALRHGIIDFMVNHLDEALRILKNEIRKQQPVSVALTSEPVPAIAEMIARGVQPDLLASQAVAELPPDAQQTFADRGAIPLTNDFKFLPGMMEVQWIAAEPSWLSRADALAADALGTGALAADALDTGALAADALDTGALDADALDTDGPIPGTPDLARPISDRHGSDPDGRRRWLRLAPRYLGRHLRLRRYLVMNSAELSRFAALAETLRDAAGQPAIQIRSAVV